MCRAPAQQRQAWPKTKKVHAVSDTVPDTGEQQGEDELYIDTITKQHANTDKEQAFAELQLGKMGHKLKFKIDTGAQANVIPANTFHELFGNVVLGPHTRQAIRLWWA